MSAFGELRVWWIRNPPNQPRHYAVKSPQEAAAVLERLAKRDLADPSVGSNAGGLEVNVKGEWQEWYSDDGEDIDEWAAMQPADGAVRVRR
jgi:hypothetical protein